ncbi:MAG: delta-60 repeat domain-containing protein, partial [Opitutaceae bacterium]
NELAEVREAWRLADGRVLVAGNFARVGSHATRDVAMLLADGSVDTRFASTTNFNGAAAVGNDGRFVGISPQVPELVTIPTFVPSSRLVRLGPTGEETESWTVAPRDFQSRVVLAVDARDRILVSVARPASPIIWFQGWLVCMPDFGATTISRFETGRVEASIFFSEANIAAEEVHLLSDGSIVLVGERALVISDGDGSQTTPPRARGLMKLTAEGKVDDAFAAQIPADVRVVGLSRAIGGWIASTRVETSRTMARFSLVKLDANFGAGAPFAAEFRDAARVEAAWPLVDGSILLQGAFTPFDAVEAQRFAKLGSTGEFDFVHVPRPAGAEQAGVIHVGTDGRIYVISSGGDSVERYAADGTRDEAFAQRMLADGAATITAVHVDSAGRVVFGGPRRWVEILAPGVGPRAIVQRLLPSGQRDDTFVFQGPDSGLGTVNAIAELPGGGYAIAGQGNVLAIDESGAAFGKPVARMYEAAVSQLVRTGGFTYALGEFASILGVNSRGLVRLGADGFPDPSWSSALDGSGRVVALQALGDGRLLVTREVYPVPVAFTAAPAAVIRETLAAQAVSLFPRHVILTAQGRIDPNENQPAPGESPVTLLPPDKTTLAAATDGMLYEFTPDGRGRRFRPVPRPVVTPSSEDFVYFDAGESLRLEVQLAPGASGVVQWFRNGELLVGETGTVFQKRNSASRDAGIYTARYEEAGNAPVFATFRVRLSRSAARLVNVSARSFVGEGADRQIVGFIVDGFSVEPTLLRSVQDELKNFGIAVPARETSLALHVNGQPVLAPNAPFAGARSPGALENIVLRTGAFSVSDLAANPHVLLTPNPTLNYTLHFSAAASEAGLALHELFLPTPFVGGLYEQVPQRFVNFSCRAKIGVGERVLVVGFVIEGNRPLPLLIHALGPRLRAFGLTDATSDPFLELHRGSQLVGSSDDWSRQPDASEIALTGTRLGATALAPGSADAALLTLLDPGAYTVILRGKDAGESVGMIEIYDAR